MHIDTEAFIKALEQHPEALKALSWDTRRRYLSGQLPRVVVWLLSHPEIMITATSQIVSADQDKTAPALER